MNPRRDASAAFAKNFLPWSLTSRPPADAVPAIGLIVCYYRVNASAF
jgi:hypothetical protein